MEYKCPHCGAPLPEDASFCPHCAQSIRTREKADAPVHLWRKGLKWVLALVLLAAVAVAAWAVYHNKPSTTFPPGETTPVILEEDENGMVTVTPDLMQEYFPTLTGINFGTTSQTSENIDDYLLDSFQMAILVASQGTESSVGEWGQYKASQDSSNRVCLLIYDENTHLMGYFIGSPTHLGDGRWQMDVVSCDYDFTQLYEEQRSAFEQSWQEDFSTYIPPEELESFGTVWFVSGYNTGQGPVLREDDAQLYYLWHTLHAPDLEQKCREIQRLEEFLPNEGRWRCYLFLDENYELLGYTMLDYQGNGG
ncbi:MAG TPA: zinc ribbon domain-containing protein [Candidatus Flavonifractor merdigallinarum]|uniref:Zinc ribbon domain-containing protein n=1 Tax=Candidatus Flavonifractor merdigallinarum TaxID=2838589 RepID=A0A9D1Y743_9FIRM|nr:zinc ribbon domain-containing protein [Candidatus Flavonifractor merdigallinarum]